MKISKTPSAPCWADLSTPDPQAAALFYEALFGWHARPVDDPAGGGYAVFALDRPDGPQVCGVRPVTAPKQPAAWLPYFQTAGIDAVTSRVRGNGGRVVAGPMGVLDQGRLAVCQDRAGAAFGLWEPAEHAGFQAVDVPGGFCWFELLTRDTEGAVDFFQSVLGWGARRCPAGPGSPAHTEWTVADETFGGMLDMASAGMPPEVPPHWNLYVAVTDPDAVARRCAELAGQVLVEPRTVEPGRFAVLADPQGATFSVMRFADGSGR
ncbi:VOC family protein [Streptomyces beihaiensis]|uniref:VOC family protein n=1 Tax=Streptomyces beihaiensis TaxID=2984495 RepID=A0ABT3TSQ6_9ACTN|nr:VOC family protein [Streptomyces beihaiensis]MCX3060074.1 VOC family protein [Streptomyces beihaiensis]